MNEISREKKQFRKVGEYRGSGKMRKTYGDFEKKEKYLKEQY